MGPGDTRARHARSKEILLVAMDLPAGEREAYLARACGEDGELLADARSLLAELTHLDGFLDGAVQLPRAPAECPERLGPYRIVRVLGRGGMGIVYLAEQPSPRREVALKVLRLDAATETARARFAREAEVLARCRHPGIAQVHAASVIDTDVGPQPVICMEYVAGRPIVEEARARDLDRRQRIELVLQVADALGHAHAQGVLHRDLKPDNVLVDEGGRARILDFGVAHVVGEDPELVTRTGQVLGTVAYMSPEQARGGHVDERTDVFSLGVILYELLTGRLPYETRGALVHEALRVLAESEATPLSRHDPALRGDLETILATALASEPARRYRSAADLTADLRAYLGDRPISARPPSPAYVLSKFARRHWLLSLVVVAVCLALGGGAAVALQAMTRAEEQTGFTELFADRNLLAVLTAEAEELWPADSTRVAAMDAWLVRAREVGSRLGAHRARVAQVERLGPDLDQGAAVDPSWLLEEGRALVVDLEHFAGPEGRIAEIERRRARAAELRALTVEAHAEAWEAAARRVRDDPRFAGLALAPQEGLVPLGPDPDSGLEEFAHHGPTGTLPTRDPGSGRLVLDGGSAAVLVLVPGGEVLIGNPGEVHMSPHLGPPVRIPLDPYLIGKHELTQGQFLRAFGFNPSDHAIGDDWVGRTTEERNPVEGVSWDQAVRLLARLGMELPTEAQWEAAARAGSPERYVVGADARSLMGFANLGGSYSDRYPVPHWTDDGYSSHAPVGTFAANAYGLHDVLGNVWELCRDTYKVRYHHLEHRAGDGLVIAEPDGDVARRGNGFESPLEGTSVYLRGDRRHSSPDSTTGLRVAWTLRGSGGRERTRDTPGSHGSRGSG